MRFVGPGLWYVAAMTADQALEELLEVSPQIEATVIAERDGSPIAASMGDAGAGSDTLAAHGLRVLERAEAARIELGREPVVQCEIATGDGHVFVVTDSDRYIVAVTGADPTVGLVFYDLKTALRTVRDGAGASNGGQR